MTFAPGHPKWGGRKKGTVSRKVLARQQAFEDALNACDLLPETIATMTPLATMLVVMRHRLTAKDYDGALVAAEAAAPFVHPRLASADLTVRNTDVSKSDAELAAELAEIRAKSEAAA